MSMTKEDSLVMQLGKGHSILLSDYAKKQSPCVLLFIIIFLHINRLWELRKAFINFVCPEVTAL